MHALTLLVLVAMQADAGADADADAGAGAGADDDVAVRLIAVPTIAWVEDAKKKGDGVIVVHHRKGACPKTHEAACIAGVFDGDVHTLRAVSLATGKEKWRNTKTPLLLGELRRERDDVVVAIVTSDLPVTSVALLDPATGKPTATCANASDAGGDAPFVRFQARHLDATGAFFIQRIFRKNGGARPPDVPPVLLRATSPHACTLAEGAATPPLTWPREDERVHYGGDARTGFIDVTIEGRRRRIVIDEQPKCRRFACQPIP